MTDTKTVKTEKAKIVAKEESPKFKGRFIETVGRRKTSIARVRLYKKGSGIIVVNEDKLNSYLPSVYGSIVKQPLELTGNLKDLDFSIVVSGGGKKGQAEAMRHGICRSLLELDIELKASLKAKGWLTRDARRKERKKPGLKKARKAPQWSKR